ncbi:hypothetical protein V496_06578 [Pseudogymnoascus sp. VKM F-4515 (FW-2607)]|nr:hypothetical protein V496_06578 [Pseudogymnoascus sp. VKM F-4515 (FW-2607)]KFY68695.1 hypothetical protein V498_10579 [Pseudogymnoascus sp. VKM F-4517 (FW-2822)]
MPARIRSARHVDSGPDLFANIYIRSSSSAAHKPDAYTAASVATGSSSAMMESSTANGVLIGLLSSFGSALFIALVFLVVYFFRYTQGGRILLDRIGRPGEYDDEQSFLREEAEALETMEEGQRIDYLRAKAFIESNPPDSLPTDISLSQYLAIQEKGVSAWEFEPELEIANCFVEARTEIEFFDSECCVLSNLPVPKQNEVYYWESKIYDKPEQTMISIGMATKPYPLFRLPGWHKYSVAYTSTGQRRYNQPFTPTSYGPPYVQGDVIGVGYRPRTGTLFFTRNGKKLDDVAHGLKSQNLFPAVGANGPCTVHVNFGQSGFVFIEANVKKWGLAPMTGSLAPPPPYGSEQGSILLEAGGAGGATETAHNHQPSRHGRTRSGNIFRGHPTSPGPVRSPTDISLAHLVHIPPPPEDGGESSAGRTAGLHPNAALHVARHQEGLGITLPPVTPAAPVEDHTAHPPPEYSSPPQSRRGSDSDGDGERRRLLGGSSGRRGQRSPPIPSYSDAVAEGRRGEERSRSGTV